MDSVGRVRFLVAVLAALELNACAKKESDEIKVGVVQALTGMYAAFGQGGVFGIKAAVEDINKQGGVRVGGKRIPLRLSIVDNESDPNKAGSVAESLIVQDKVHFIVSGDEPPPMHPGVSQAAERHKVVYITSAGPEEPWVAMRQEAPTQWQYTWAAGLFAIVDPAPKEDFRSGSGYTIVDTWMTLLARFGANTNKKVGILCSDDADGRGWYMLFGPALRKAGYDVVGLDKHLGLIPLETTDFSSAVEAWKEAKVEILWGNCPGPFFGAAWKQAHALGFRPKMVSIGRGALYYEDVAAWGGELPNGITTEVWWDPSMTDSPGIAGTTPASLAERWVSQTKQPVNRAIGPGYRTIQVLIDAIERAGSLESRKVNEALAKTDLPTIGHRVRFDANHFSRGPLVFGQWFRTAGAQPWELKVVSSNHDFLPSAQQAAFPKPY